MMQQTCQGKESIVLILLSHFINQKNVIQAPFWKGAYLEISLPYTARYKFEDYKECFSLYCQINIDQLQFRLDICRVQTPKFVNVSISRSVADRSSNVNLLLLQL